MTNISFLESEIDLHLDGRYRVCTSVHGGAIDLHDANGYYVATLDEDEATFEVISSF
jgi:hypothetical protein